MAMERMMVVELAGGRRARLEGQDGEERDKG
jgi:hypothetical protein